MRNVVPTRVAIIPTASVRSSLNDLTYMKDEKVLVKDVSLVGIESV